MKMMKRFLAILALVVLFASTVLAPVSVSITATTPDGTVRTGAPSANDDLTCTINGRTTGYNVLWYVNNPARADWIGNPFSKNVRDQLGISLKNADLVECIAFTPDGFRVGSASVSIASVPIVTVTAPPGDSHLVAGHEIQFAADVSDPEGQPLTLVWDFGDGLRSSEEDPKHTYSAEGTMPVTLTATDPDGNMGRDTITINILKEAFRIENLNTYLDSAFSTQSDVFFRSNPLFVQFDVEDLQGYAAAGLTVEGFVQNRANPSVVLPLAPLTSPAPGTYRLQRSVIPTDDGILGQNVVIVVSFVGLDGGQDSKVITILNNPPTLGAIPDVALAVGEQVVADLNTIAADVETADADLLFDVDVVVDSDGVNSALDLDPGTHRLTITGQSAGCDTLSVSVEDGDGGLVTQAFMACVRGGPGGVPVAALTANPQHAKTGESVVFDAAGSTDDGAIVIYTFDFGDGTTVTSQSPVVTHAYLLEGHYLATVTVTDNNGLSDDASIVVNVSWNRPNAGVVNENGKQFREGFPHDIQLSRVQLLPWKSVYRPGEQVNMVLEVRNPGSTNERLQFRVLVQGWNDVALADQVIASGDVRLNSEASFTVPKNVKPGTYVVRVDLTSTNGLVGEKKYLPIRIGGV